jgi:hypothetical protein
MYILNDKIDMKKYIFGEVLNKQTLGIGDALVQYVVPA